LPGGAVRSVDVQYGWLPSHYRHGVDDVRRRVAAWWLGLTALGIVIIAIPDSGDPLVTMSNGHGPGLIDLLGILVVLIGTGVLYRHLFVNRETIMTRLGRPLVIVLVISWVVAVAAAIGAVVLDRGLWWIVGVLDATAAHAFALAMSQPAKEPTDPHPAGPA
jgi:hypothetical protein